MGDGDGTGMGEGGKDVSDGDGAEISEDADELSDRGREGKAKGLGGEEGIGMLVQTEEDDGGVPLTASTACPPLFTPYCIDKKFCWSARLEQVGHD